MHILEISKSSSAKTEFSFFFGIFSSVFGFFVFFNTDVGVGFLKYHDIGFGYRLGSTVHHHKSAVICCHEELNCIIDYQDANRCQNLTDASINTVNANRSGVFTAKSTFFNHTLTSSFFNSSAAEAIRVEYLIF